MRISIDEVRQIATLARLELSPEEVESMSHDLASILDHMEALGSVDVSGVAPVGGMSEHSAPMREDEHGADPLDVPIETLAPAMEESFFVVPRLAALDADALSGEGEVA